MDLFSIAFIAGAALSVLYKLSDLFPKNSLAKKAMRAIPRTDIKTTASNRVSKVAGEIVPLSDTLSAPLTGASCVCYEMTIEELITDGRDKRWVMLAQDTHRQDFLLRQDNEEALVKVRYASVHLIETLRGSGSMKRAPARIQAFLEKHGEVAAGRSRQIRYSEGFLSPGKLAAVSGFSVREVDRRAESVGYRDAGTRLAFAHTEEHDLYISNDPATFL